MFIGYLTSRETASMLGQRSGGTARASGWERIPLIRMTNVNLEPGTWKLDDLIADTDDGLYMETNRSWSIDDRRLNFQFGTEWAREIKNGNLGDVVRNATYTGMTPQFWGSCDAVCDADGLGRLGHAELRQRAARAGGAHRPRRLARALPQRPCRADALRRRRVRLTALALSMAALAACGGDDSGDAPARARTATTTPPSSRTTPPASATPAPPGSATDARGPLEAGDLVTALAARGLAYRASESTFTCEGSTVDGRIYFGTSPSFVLWAYPTTDALLREWRAELGKSPEPLADCDISEGATLYWNNNLVLMIENDPDAPPDLTVRHEITTAFLSLAP